MTNAAKSDNVTIPGLLPVDVYLNMEKNGFKTSKDLGGEYGNSWKCTSTEAGLDYTVEIFSHGSSTVETVSATARVIDVQSKNISATQQFIVYVSSLPYEGSDPIKVAKWIDTNFNIDKASITISKVKYTIYAPSKYVRMLSIERETPTSGTE